MENIVLSIRFRPFPALFNLMVHIDEFHCIKEIQPIAAKRFFTINDVNLLQEKILFTCKFYQFGVFLRTNTRHSNPKFPRPLAHLLPESKFRTQYIHTPFPPCQKKERKKKKTREEVASFPHFTGKIPSATHVFALNSSTGRNSPNPSTIYIHHSPTISRYASSHRAQTLCDVLELKRSAYVK